MIFFLPSLAAAFRPLILGLTKIWVKMSSFNRILTWRKTALNTRTNVCRGDGYSKLAHNLLRKSERHPGLRSIGKSGFRFWNPDFGFAIEREIRKRISPPRNPSLGRISIRKSKSGFHGFPFYRSIGKSEKGFAKLFSWTAVFFLLIMRARARPLFLRTLFQILFGFPNRTVKMKIIYSEYCVYHFHYLTT